MCLYSLLNVSLKLQQPQTVTLGTRLVWKRLKKKRIVRVKDTFQYVPFLESLEVTCKVDMYHVLIKTDLPTCSSN